MKKILLGALLLIAVGIVVYTFKNPVPPPPPPPPPPFPPDWLEIIDTQTIDLETILKWLKSDESRLKSAPASVIGFIVKADKGSSSETARQLKAMLPGFQFEQGYVLVGFYDKETKNIQTELKAVLYKAQQISEDLMEQFGKNDLIIIE